MWIRRLNYRDLLWIAKTAVMYGLKGVTFIRNDGCAEIIAEGEDRILNAFAEEISRGRLFLTKVDNFAFTWHEPKGGFHDFSIKDTSK
jgi:acylphosphatase